VDSDRIDQKTEDVMQFMHSEITQHPPDLVQALDLTRFLGKDFFFVISTGRRNLKICFKDFDLNI